MNEILYSIHYHNEYANKMAIVLGRTSNIVGEFAEFIFNKYYNSIPDKV